MSIVVQKYGGSSVADADRIRAVAERVMRTKQAGHDVVMVVSAMGDTTDDLPAMTLFAAAAVAGFKSGLWSSSRRRDQPVAESVPDTQPIFSCVP